MWEMQGDILVNYLLTIPVTICLQYRPEKSAACDCNTQTGTHRESPCGECRAPPQREENCPKNLESLIASVLLKKWGKNPALFLNKLAEESRKWSLPQLLPAVLFISKPEEGLYKKLMFWTLYFFLASAWSLPTTGLGSVFENYLNFVPSHSLEWCFWSAEFGWLLQRVCLKTWQMIDLNKINTAPPIFKVVFMYNYWCICIAMYAPVFTLFTWYQISSYISGHIN